MTKAENIADPNSCWNKAKDDSIVFILHDKDPDMAETIRFWARRRVEKGRNASDDPKITSALETAVEVEIKQNVLGPTK